MEEVLIALPGRRIGVVLILCYSLLFLCCSGNRDSEASNRLQHAASPYLRQHADNPVQWYEWGTEALEKAKRENKPIIISVGYASCHWCHVMEAESFMDTAVARRMNEHFVSIKIDREERPDIDQIYLEAAQLISGNSGWPLNAFALPDGKPFYAATYFPKDQWIRLLDKMIEAYQTDHAAIVRQANALTNGIQSNELELSVANERRVIGVELGDSIAMEWERYLDYNHGGIKGTQKFPLPGLWEFYLQRYKLTGDEAALKIVNVTLDNLHRGGIYDHLAGGFARYTTDSTWRIPHFEKMLYDNAQLVTLYAHALQVTGNRRYEDVIRQTLSFVEEELTSTEGAFYASINADTEGEEGKFYVWTKDEILRELAPEDATLIIDLYQVSEVGNWEKGRNILFRKHTDEDYSALKGLHPREFVELRKSAEQKLLQVRQRRPRPAVDTKIISSWNALMMKAFTDAFLATGDDGYLQRAIENAEFLQNKMMNREGHLFRTYMNGRAATDAFLDDYALVARAMIQLYQATFDKQWLEYAKSLTDYARQHFDDEQTALYFYAQRDTENLVARKKEVWDNVIPSSNAVFAEVLFLLGEYYGNTEYHDAAINMITAVIPNLKSAGPYYAHWAAITGLVGYEPYEVAILGEKALEKSRAMQKAYHPTAIFMGGNSENLPLLKNKMVKDRTMIYVCRRRICKSPETEVEKALSHMD